MKTTEQIRQQLGVSGATISNWIKTGIIPKYPNGKSFDENTYNEVLENIKNNFSKLQKRANRSNNATNTVNTSTITNLRTKEVIEKLLLIYQKSCDSFNISLDFFMFSLCLFLLAKKKVINIIQSSENGYFTSSNEDFTHFLLVWFENTKKENNFIIVSDLMRQFEILNILENEKDFLGSTYESLRTVNDKSMFGAYFTPFEIIADIEIPLEKTVLDPCAGTGTFILSTIKKEHSPEKITLRDIDNLALNIAKINFVLFFGRVDVLINTEVRDIFFDNGFEQKNDLFSSNNALNNQKKEVFDYILTNPPYGAKLAENDKKRILNDYPLLKTTESFSIALYNCINKLAENGKISVILPESLLYVDTHINIRKYLFNLSKNIKILHFGNAFKGIMSKIIRLDIENNNQKPEKNNVTILNKNIQWSVSNEIIAKNNYRPPYILDLQDIGILDKIFKTDTFTLENKCKFGLGIVTGNNDLHLKTAFSEGLEPIFTGKELNAFKFEKPKYYINFEPKNLQQVAPIALYRQNKICYCFISDKITTVADTENSLVLNSINFFIPDKNIPLRALSAFLNAEIITFIYQRLCNSIKVLRNHIENFPIPKSFFDNIDVLNDFYEQSTQGIDVKIALNQFVGMLYRLTETEIKHITKSI